METIMNKIKEAVQFVIEENQRFDYVASKCEIANSIWHAHLDCRDRALISQHVNATSQKGIKQLRVCLEFVQSNMGV